MAGSFDGLREQLAAMMAAMPGGPETMEQCGFDFERFGRPRSREELLADHALSRKKLAPPNYSQTAISWTHHNDVKPVADFPHPPSVHDCTPVHVHSLKPQNTHRGRLLRGTLATQPVVIVGVQTLLEDELGNLVNVSFYNALPGVPQDRTSQWYAAERLFSRGRRIAILEPYFKLAADGTFLVRVDNPRELLWLDALGPSDADGWRAEGVCKSRCTV